VLLPSLTKNPRIYKGERRGWILSPTLTLQVASYFGATWKGKVALPLQVACPNMICSNTPLGRRGRQLGGVSNTPL